MPTRPDIALSLSGLAQARPPELVVDTLITRARRRLEVLDDAALTAMLEDAVYHEHRRLERATPGAGEVHRLDALARALVRGGRAEQLGASLEVMRGWAGEIHRRFSRRAYGVATQVLPRALGVLLSSRPQHLRDWTHAIDSRLELRGDLELLRTLASEATLLLVPTHVSNLDSPLIGLALQRAGLPPFVYGAGLNLFSNPLMGWWMSRLGAYTVDRTKHAALYKDLLKDYSVERLTTRHHSLFFPGGTRARSGAIENRLKKGLLGTGIEAWQEMIVAGRPDADVYVVPMTLSFQLVLEASTLIDDHLAEAGKQRYIISDDEFSEPATVLRFVQRVLGLDAAVVAHFGAPLDVLGRPVPVNPIERREASAERRLYVCDRNGVVERDPQRDRIYTDRLASAIVRAYPKGAVVLSTHLTAWTAWRALARQLEVDDPFRIIRAPLGRRHLPLGRVLDDLERARVILEAGAREGRWGTRLPGTAREILDAAVQRFGAFHSTHALRIDGNELIVEDPRLCLYYHNRLAWAPLED